MADGTHIPEEELMTRSSAVRSSGSSAALLLLFMLIACSFSPRIDLARPAEEQLRLSVQSFNTSGRAFERCQMVSAAPRLQIQPRTPGLSHSPILIQNDSDFANQALVEGWSGDGTSGSPYCIEGLLINCTASGGSCVEISHTTACFTLRGCTLLAGASAYAAIRLSEVTNGCLFNNTCSTLTGGVIVSNSRLVTIVNTNSSSSASKEGIALLYCNETTLVNVRCEDNNVGLSLQGGANNTVVNSSFINNKPGYWGIGADIWNSSYNLLANNTFFDNKHDIVLEGDCNTLCNNRFMGSPYGIWAGAASHNTISGNWFEQTAWGLHFWSQVSGGNLIEANAFIGGNVGDEGYSLNTYDRNYWSYYNGPDKDGDGIGDFAYYLTSTRNSYDHRPLMLPPGSPATWLEVPATLDLPYAYPIWSDLDATATPPGLAHWWLNDTTLFAIDQHGVLTNRVVLAVGTYSVEVSVSDWMNNTITARVAIIVRPWTIHEIPVVVFIVGMVAVVSAAASASIIGIARRRRTTNPPPTDTLEETRQPVDQQSARCPICGSHLFGDEGYCPGCGNRVNKPSDR